MQIYIYFFVKLDKKETTKGGNIADKKTKNRHGYNVKYRFIIGRRSEIDYQLRKTKNKDYGRHGWCFINIHRHKHEYISIFCCLAPTNTQKCCGLTSTWYFTENNNDFESDFVINYSFISFLFLSLLFSHCDFSLAWCTLLQASYDYQQ